MNGAVIAVAIIAAVAIGGLVFLMVMQSRQRQQAATDPAALIGQGLGNILTGVIGAASA